MRRGLKKCWIFSLAVFLSLTTILARVPPDLTVYAQSKDVEVSAVDLDGNSLGKTVSFAGGDITEASAPKIEGKRFIRAYVIDSVTNKKEAIQSIESRGGRAYIKRINESVDALERSYLSTDTASKVYFEYLDLAKTVMVTYQPEEGKDIIVTGPPHLELVNGIAVGYFTVSVPRNAKPIIETKEVAFDQDVSTTKRTVYRYKITTSQDLNIPIRSEVKETLTITAKASNDGKHADDWKMSGLPVCNIGEATDNNSYGRACVRQDYFYAQTEIVTGNITNQDIANKNSVGEQITESTETSSYGSTVHLKAYHDMTYWGGNVPAVYSTFMSILWINGQPFGAPQPFARFGPSAYENTSKEASYKRPYYEDVNASWESRPGYANKYTLVSTFGRRQGWEPYWGSRYWSEKNRDNGFYNWYNDIIKRHVIGQKTQTYVQHGPLAGATVTITITDAKPDNYRGSLNTFHEYKDGDGWDDTSAYNKGQHNSLRLAYDIQIDNAPTYIEAIPEWASTNQSKVGMYLNYGVEDTWVHAAVVNETGSGQNKTSTVNDPADWHKSDSSWFTTANSNDRYVNGVDTKWDKDFNREKLDDPLTSIVGKVKNGYTKPMYRDMAISDVHLVPNSREAKYNDKYAEPGDFFVNAPVFVKIGNSIEDNRKNGYVSVGGMNVIGVEAELLHLPVDYYLDGGTVQTPSDFPDAATSKADGNERFMYDVEGNPIIHVPLEVPTRENSQFVGWGLYKVNNGVKGEKIASVAPGEDIDIRNEALFGRISDTLGNVNFDTVRLEAEYIGTEQQAADAFVVNHVYKENEDSEQEDGTAMVGSFISIHGTDSSLTESGEKKFAPDKLEYNGNKYKLVLSDDASPRGGYTTFTDTSTSMTFTYVRTRGTVKVRYEDTEGNLLPDTNEITLVDNGLEGTEYESTKEEFSDYVFVDMKEDSAPAKGTVQEGDQTVVYVYRPKVKVPNTGLDVPMGPTLAILLDAVLATGIFLLIRRKRRGL